MEGGLSFVCQPPPSPLLTEGEVLSEAKNSNQNPPFEGGGRGIF